MAIGRDIKACVLRWIVEKLDEVGLTVDGALPSSSPSCQYIFENDEGSMFWMTPCPEDKAAWLESFEPSSHPDYPTEPPARDVVFEFEFGGGLDDDAAKCEIKVWVLDTGLKYIVDCDPFWQSGSGGCCPIDGGVSEDPPTLTSPPPVPLSSNPLVGHDGNGNTRWVSYYLSGYGWVTTMTP